MSEKIKYPDDFTRCCSNCKYCDTIVNPAQATSAMFCRKATPGAAAQCIGINPTNQQPMWVFATTWPSVTPQDWCGEHVRKLQ
jgi:hypothetical protein